MKAISAKGFALLIAIAVFDAFAAGVWVKFDAQGGAFAISGMMMNLGATPDVVVTQCGYDDPVRMGYNFAGWSSIASPQDDSELDHGFEAYYSGTVTKATTFYAIWERQEPYLNDGNGCWKCEEYGLSCVITNGNGTSCSYDVPGRGWISFRYRLVDQNKDEQELGVYGYMASPPSDSYCCYISRAPYNDYIYTNEAVYNYTSEDFSNGWWYVRCPVRSVSDEYFTWSIFVDEWVQEQYGENPSRARLEIAEIKFTPAEDNPVAVHLETCGGTLPDGVSDGIVFGGPEYGALPTPTREGCEFLGWSEYTWHDLRCDPPFYSITDNPWLPLASNVTIYAVWDVPLEIAIDPDGSFRNGGANWNGENWLELGGFDDLYACASWLLYWGYDDETDEVYAYYAYAGEYVRGEICELLQHESRDIITLYVRGCGTLHVPLRNVSGWETDSGHMTDDVEILVYVDELEKNFPVTVKTMGSIDLEIGDCPDEIHEIRIALHNNAWESIYAYATIDGIHWVEAPSEMLVSFGACGGVLEGDSVRTFPVGYEYGEFPVVRREGFDFGGWFADADCTDQVFEGELVRLSVTNLYAKWETDLKTALGDGALRYATKGDYRWGGVSDHWHGTNYASAGTCDVWWGKTNVMTTVVQGQGLLSFWWMKGETGWDDDHPSLTLWLDGEKVVSCHRVSKWRHVTLPVLGRGNHKVEWKYTPDPNPYLAYTYYSANPVFNWRDTYVSPTEMWQTYCYWARQYGTTPPCRPGAWVDEVAWMPVNEVDDVVSWAKGVVEGNAWLTNSLPIIEAAYTAKMATSPQNYELPMLRAFTKLARIGENENLLAVLRRFGLAPNYQKILSGFLGELDYWDAPLSNEAVDSVADETTPVIESALDDLELIPVSWNGSVALHPSKYPVSVVTHVDIADVTFAKAAMKGALAAIAIAESYDLSVDYMNGEMEVILAEAGLKTTFEHLVEDHPDFMKRVRNLERLVEGRELLRDALTTLQEFDELMLARSDSDLHFFEYDEKDADKQQNAREEVAKILAALDGMVELGDSDLRNLPNYRLENLSQEATLVPFFGGDLTRRFLPAQTKGNVPVFDTFPGMSFGGTLPGLTKETVAGWLSLYGRNVEYTPDSDYDPPVTYRTFNAAIPRLGKSATSDEIKDALAGTADAAVAKNVSDAQKYDEYEKWASRLAASGVPLKAIKSSSSAWMSYALGTSALLSDNIKSEDIKIESFEPSKDGGFVLEVSIVDVGIGDGVEITEENMDLVKENIRKVLGIEGSPTLNPSRFSADNVEIVVDSPENGNAKFRVSPLPDAGGSFFMRVKVK